MNPSKAFARLLDLQSSTEARERLHEFRGRHQLDESDALWSLVELLQQQWSEAKEHAETPHYNPVPWPWVCMGAAAQTLFASLCVVAGAHLFARPAAWSHGQIGGLGELGRAVLSLPVGWLAFLLILPVGLAGVGLGRRVSRAGEHAMGWGLVALSCAAIGGCCYALVRMLHRF